MKTFSQKPTGRAGEIGNIKEKHRGMTVKNTNICAIEIPGGTNKTRAEGMFGKIEQVYFLERKKKKKTQRSF